MTFAEIQSPKNSTEVARTAGTAMALVLQAKLIDKGVSFAEAANAAIRALPFFQDHVIGLLSPTDVLAVDLGDERGGRVQVYANMDAAIADRELARHRHVAVEIGQVVADVLKAGKGNVIDAHRIN